MNVTLRCVHLLGCPLCLSSWEVGVAFGKVDMEERYEPLKELGSGNFGVARLARDKKTEELVAVKYIERGKKVNFFCQIGSEIPLITTEYSLMLLLAQRFSLHWLFFFPSDLNLETTGFVLCFLLLVYELLYDISGPCFSFQNLKLDVQCFIISIWIKVQ